MILNGISGGTSKKIFEGFFGRIREKIPVEIFGQNLGKFSEVIHARRNFF